MKVNSFANDNESISVPHSHNVSLLHITTQPRSAGSLRAL